MMSEIERIKTPSGPAKLQRTGRRTLAIHVLPDGSLELTAPQVVTVEAILAKVEKRSRWIETQRRNFREMNVVPMLPRYVSGATHRYLGRQYRLKVSHGKLSSVRLKGAYFEVVCTDEDPQTVKNLMELWFRKRAKDQFSRRVEAWSPWCRKHHLQEPTMQIRRMSKRWGSAGVGGRIALNPILIHAPARCIDYVIAHEICHLRHPNHDRSFYRFLAALLPDWRSLKQRLEETEIF
jgi:predicted metal-dependent hydrolase